MVQLGGNQKKDFIIENKLNNKGKVCNVTFYYNQCPADSRR